MKSQTTTTKEYQNEPQGAFEGRGGPGIRSLVAFLCPNLPKLCHAIARYFWWWRIMRNQELDGQVKHNKKRSLGIPDYSRWCWKLENDLRRSSRAGDPKIALDSKLPLAAKDSTENLKLFLHDSLSNEDVDQAGAVWFNDDEEANAELEVDAFKSEHQPGIKKSFIDDTEDRFLDAIDKGEIQDLIDYQQRSRGWDIEPLTEDEFPDSYLLDDKQNKILYLSHIQGPYLKAKITARREQLKTGNVWTTLSRCQEHIEKGLFVLWHEKRNGPRKKGPIFKERPPFYVYGYDLTLRKPISVNRVIGKDSLHWVERPYSKHRYPVWIKRPIHAVKAKRTEVSKEPVFWKKYQSSKPVMREIGPPGINKYFFQRLGQLWARGKVCKDLYYIKKG